MTFRLGICQIGENPKKHESRIKVEEVVRGAADKGAQIVALPEMWSCPYSNEYFKSYAEPDQGPTVELMSKVARENQVYLIGGSVPELDGDKVYNTCYIFDRRGNIIDKHRKVHLFDIDVPGKIRFMESETLTSGDQVTVVDTEYGLIGVAICYDIRFPEMIMAMAVKGAKLIVLPAAFNTTTGPAHWDLTMRARALDNQVYLAAVSPAQVKDSVYTPYGHSMIVDPWGKVLCQAQEEEAILIQDIDMDYLEQVRNQLPLLKHRRREIYSK